MAKATTNRNIRSVVQRRIVPGVESLAFCLALAFAAALTLGVLG